MLEHFLLFDTHAICRFTSMVSVCRVSWFHSILQFIDVNCVVTSLVDDWDNIAKLEHFNIVCSEHIFKPLSKNDAFILVVKKAEAFINIECFMTVENFFSNFNLPLVLQHHLN